MHLFGDLQYMWFVDAIAQTICKWIYFEPFIWLGNLSDRDSLTYTDFEQLNPEVTIYTP